MERLYLKQDEVSKTIKALYERITGRFPQSGLGKVCIGLHKLSLETNAIAQQIARPNYGLRLVIGFVIVMLLILIVYSVSQCEFENEQLGLADFVQITEAA